MESKKEEIEELIKIVNEVFFTDISKNSRKRTIVDARKIYSKILREKGFCYQSIADSLDKDHATIIHYIRTIDSILEYDKTLRNMYMTCKSIFLKKSELISAQRNEDMDLYMSVTRLTGELRDSSLKSKKLLSNFVDYIEDYEKINGYFPSIKECRLYCLCITH